MKPPPTAIDAGTGRATALVDARRDRHGLHLAALLERGCADLPPEVPTRLAEARRQALAVLPALPARQSVPVPATAGPAGALHPLPEAPRHRLGGWVLAAALLAGLVLVQHWQESRALQTRAQVELQLLLGEVPPAAYADPAFAAFLRHGRR